MAFNPSIHKRRSIRLKGYDYSQAGLYFVTICCFRKKCWFGKITNDEMILNEYGRIAFAEWQRLPERFPNVELDVFQIMPNHIHAIIALRDVTETVGAGLAPAHPSDTNHVSNQNNAEPVVSSDHSRPETCRAGASPAPTDVVKPPTVGDVVGAYKSLVANTLLELFKTKNETLGKLWQRNYHEHIIRNAQSHNHIADYIIHNPAKWQDDRFYVG